MFTKNTISSHKVEVLKNGTGCLNGNLIVTDNDKDFGAEAKRARMTIPLPAIRVESSKVRTTDDGFMISEYAYQTTDISEDHSKGGYVVRPIEHKYTFRTDLQVPKTGLLMVGWGGNNGSTVTAGILANKLGLSWATRTGRQSANYFGSMTQSSTFRLGTVFNEKLGKFEEIYSPISSFLPTVDPNDLVLGGWDISGKNLAEAVERAQVLEPDLQRQVATHLQTMKPLPSIFYPDFVAANQSKRADNLIEGESKGQHLTRIRSDIRKFKEENRLGHVTVVWTATTERYCDVIKGVNDTAENLLRSIDASHPEIAPSTMFAVAAILENVPFINGSPQNTCVPGVVDLAGKRDVFIGGDDFKTGQTKLKSVLVDFLVSAGIKPLAITSYNHLGNNDGENLSAPQQFRSKEISKSNVVNDMVDSNRLLYSKPNERPDHVVVIKYVEAVGDSKRALDEYYSEIFMGGHSTIVVHNTCEDSLLAAPLIVDLVVLTELFSRITYKSEKERNGELVANDDDDGGFQRMNCVLSILAYYLKAPLVPKGAPVVNALFRQRQALENVLRACVGLGPQNDMMLEHICFR